MGSLVQGIGSFIGGRQANETNTEQANANRSFNAQQAQIQRDWSSAEAAKQRGFQDMEQTKAENWMQMMSDTAMTRRAQDLNAAGFNPLLAIGAGGASSPGIGAPSGAMGQASAAQAPGFAGAQNALGMGVNAFNSAQAVAAQAKLNDALAKKTTSETPVPRYIETDSDGTVSVNANAGHELGEANLAKIMASTGVDVQTATQIAANVNYIKSQIENTNADTALKNVMTRLQGVNAEVLQGTKQAVIDEATAKGAAARNVAAIEGGQYGPILKWITTLLQPASSAAGIAAKFIP